MAGNEYMFYYGFQSPGERTSFQNGILKLGGDGTDMGCGIMVNKDIAEYSVVSFKIRGSMQRKESWTRLRIEVYGSDNETLPAVSHELKDTDRWEHFALIKIPLENKVSGLFKIQMMVIGPAVVDLEFKDIQFT